MSITTTISMTLIDAYEYQYVRVWVSLTVSLWLTFYDIEYWYDWVILLQ